MSINTITKNIWIEKSRQILKEKNICECKLKNMFKNIYFPWSCKYDYQRNYYSLLVQQRPLFIVEVNTIREIELILNYINEKNLTMRICAGRHSTQYLEPEVLIDIGKLNRIRLLNNNEVIVEGGCTQGQVNNFIFKNSQGCYTNIGHINFEGIFSSGAAASVGVGGITTACGVSVLRRKYGLTIDSVLSYRITLPPTNTEKAKTVISTKDNEYSDLFWALSGGGGNNFGIISQITYKIFNADYLVKYVIKWDFSDFDRVIDLWLNTSQSRPNEFTEDFDITNVNNNLQIALTGFYVVPENQTKKDAINYVNEQMKYLGGNIVITYDRYCNFYNSLVNNRVYYNFSNLTGIFADSVDINSIKNIINSSNNINGIQAIGIELIGGEIKKNNIGSFGFRNCNYFITASTKCPEQIDILDNNKWHNNALQELLTFGKGHYLGFPIQYKNIEHTNKIYFGDSYDKLKEYKTKYDPKNILTYSGTL